MYRVGLDKEFITGRDVVRFWDVDGVLAVYGYGELGVDENLGGLTDYTIYRDAVAPIFIKNFIEKYTDTGKNYVLSRVSSEEEKVEKLNFVKRNYGDKFKEENVLFTYSKDKTKVIKSVLKELGIDKKRIAYCLIDDSYDVLEILQGKGYIGLHLSSLLDIE